MIYVITIFILLLFIFRYDINGRTRYRNECYFAMLVIFILIAGLRYRLGIDTTRYLYRFYHDTPYLSQLTWEDLSFGKDPLFRLLNPIVLSMGGRFYVIQLINAAFINILLLKYIKKHTDYIFICALLYFVYQYMAMNMEEMRASMSLVVCLFANDYIIERKWIKGFTLYVIGCFFHASTIVVMLMSLFFFLRFNFLGYMALIFSFFIGYIIQPYLEDYLFIMEFNDSISEKATMHVKGDEIDKNLNVFGYLRYFLIYIYALFSLYIVKHKKCGKSLLKYEPLLFIFLCFALMSVNIGLVYRFARFYVVYYLLFVSEFIAYLFRCNSTKLGRYLVYGRAMLLLVPLFLSIAKERLVEGTWERYHPYSSIIERSVNAKREKVFSDLGSEKASDNEF